MNLTRHLELRAPLPGLVCGAYPERREAPRTRWPWQRAPYRKRLAAVRAALAVWRALDEAAFAARLRVEQGQLGRDGLSGERIVEALAAAVDGARRSLGVDAYDTQIHAALVMLDNRLAEMATGEGKTLAAALAAAWGRWRACRCMFLPPTIIWWSVTPPSSRPSSAAWGCGWTT